MSQTEPDGQAGRAWAAGYFLTCHGTVVRVDRASGNLVHAKLWPVRETGTDWSMELPAGWLTGPLESRWDARVRVLPVANSRLVHFQRGGEFLCAERDTGEVGFNRPHSGPWESFLVVSETELAALRVVLSHEWTDEADAQDAPARLTAWLDEEWTLRVGPHVADLRGAFPPITGQGRIIGLGRLGPLLERGDALPVAPELELKPRDVAHLPRMAAAAEFHAGGPARLALRGGSEFGFLPLAVCREHETWMHTAWWPASERRLGRGVGETIVVRQNDMCVLLTPGRAGLIFDENSIASDAAGLLVSSVERGVLAREGERIFVAGAALEAAPVLRGPHAVFYSGALDSYDAWVAALLRLRVMAPYLPAGIVLLVPDWAADFGPTLAAWGFGDMAVARCAAPVARLEELFWLDRCRIEDLPAELVQAARRDVLDVLGPRGAGQALYVPGQGAGSVANARIIAAVTAKHGLATHALDDMPPRARMELFRDADFVVAPHGDALANLLVCAPGTRVIELSPDCAFKPRYAQISDKLGLVHAVLPCATDDGGFAGRLTVDVGYFRHLLRMMQARR
jgi:hypothetical protein